MLNIGLCDDELNTAKIIAKTLEDLIIKIDFDAKITLITDSQKTMYDAIYDNDIDILFLDIDFKNSDKNGIEFAKDLRKMNNDFYLIFLTAHSRYTNLSFLVKTFDFLVKPVHINALTDLFIRLKDDVERNKISLFHLSNSLAIRTSDICYIEKEGNKALVYTNTRTYSMIGSVESILDRLPNYFRRVHRSYIVNEKKIISIDKHNKLIILEDKMKCPMGDKFNIEV